MESLISLAGGLKDGAFLKEVEVRRINIDENEGAETSFLLI